ncbi:hypothetical protein ACFRAO_23980 [Streptomyces sp. NPDC056656]|uniref:hypothetical protein n=1 Tax=Streptomyces sp. NPDC056656 TaxID=3345895 RepID=UPI00367EA98F
MALIGLSAGPGLLGLPACLFLGVGGMHGLGLLCPPVQRPALGELGPLRGGLRDAGVQSSLPGLDRGLCSQGTDQTLGPLGLARTSEHPSWTLQV